MPLTASGDSFSSAVPALATTTFGAGSGLLLPLLSGQMELSIISSPRPCSLLIKPLDRANQQPPLSRQHLHPIPIYPQTLPHPEGDEHMVLDEMDVRVVRQAKLRRQLTHILFSPHYADFPLRLDLRLLLQACRCVQALEVLPGLA